MSMIIYANCNISNYLLSFISLLDINSEYIPLYYCKYHELFILSLKENIYNTFIQIPNIIIKYFNRPFNNVDDDTWNEIVLELI